MNIFFRHSCFLSLLEMLLFHWIDLVNNILTSLTHLCIFSKCFKTFLYRPNQTASSRSWVLLSQFNARASRTQLIEWKVKTIVLHLLFYLWKRRNHRTTRHWLFALRKFTLKTLFSEHRLWNSTFKRLARKAMRRIWTWTWFHIA